MILPAAGAISTAAPPLTEAVVFQPVPVGAVSATEQLAPWTAPVRVGVAEPPLAERGSREARRAGAAVGERGFSLRGAARRADGVGDLQARRGRFVGVRERDRVGARGEREGGDRDLASGGGDFDGCAAVDGGGGLPACAGGRRLGDGAARALDGAGEGRCGRAAVAERGGREARRAGAAVGERGFSLRGAARRADGVGDLQCRGGRFFFRRRVGVREGDGVGAGGEREARRRQLRSRFFEFDRGGAVDRDGGLPAGARGGALGDRAAGALDGAGERRCGRAALRQRGGGEAEGQVPL